MVQLAPMRHEIITHVQNSVNTQIGSDHIYFESQPMNASCPGEDITTFKKAEVRERCFLIS